MCNPFKWFALLVTLVARATLMAEDVLSSDPVVAIINDQPVSAQEYRLIMERQVAGVYAFFKKEKGMEDQVGYWSDSGPNSPLAHLRNAVREELVRIKVLQAEAKSRGLLKSSVFADFHRDFTEENLRRREAKRLGKVIYGPLQYKLATYYYIRLGDLNHKVTQSMIEDFDPKISDAEIDRFYTENKELFGEKAAPDVRRETRQILSRKEAKKQLAALFAKAEVSFVEENVRSIVPRVDSKL